MNHQKGLTMDDRGNIYVAVTLNMAIMKISDAGVTTIARRLMLNMVCYQMMNV